MASRDNGVLDAVLARLAPLLDAIAPVADDGSKNLDQGDLRRGDLGRGDLDRGDLGRAEIAADDIRSDGRARA